MLGVGTFLRTYTTTPVGSLQRHTTPLIVLTNYHWVSSVRLALNQLWFRESYSDFAVPQSRPRPYKFQPLKVAVTQQCHPKM